MTYRPFLAAFTAALVFATPEPAPAQEAPTLEAVSFMVGCWAQPGGNGLREHYAPAARNMMTGLSQFWRGGAIADWEFHRIDARPEGGLALTPHPRGVASVSFTAAVLEDRRVVWQNLEHDFPQRIIYHRVAQDTLVARIEGGEGEEAQAMEWRMVRTSCTGS